MKKPRGRHARPRWWQRRSTRVDHCPDVPPPHAIRIPPMPDTPPPLSAADTQPIRIPQQRSA